MADTDSFEDHDAVDGPIGNAHVESPSPGARAVALYSVLPYIASGSTRARVDFGLHAPLPSFPHSKVSAPGVPDSAQQAAPLLSMARQGAGSNQSPFINTLDERAIGKLRNKERNCRCSKKAHAEPGRCD